MSRKHKKMLARIIIASVMWLAAMLLHLEGAWALLSFAVPYAVVGYDVLWKAIKKILHGRVFDEELLMSIATMGAFAISEYHEACAVMLFYQIGELFQSVAVGRSRRSIAALMDIRPDFATVIVNGKEITVSPEEVEVGQTIVVRPGERIPLDGKIIYGDTSVNMSALTGESIPADRKKGDRVISGSVNMTGVIYVRTESVYENSTVSKILELVENSSAKKAKTENFITRFARYYTPCVVICAALLALIPSVVTGEWSVWVNRALIFLVVSCPCALVISVPLSFFGGIGGASRHGVLIKGANYLEALASVDTVVFDKTGTLTKGNFSVTEINSNSLPKDELLRIAAEAESFSTHPVARSVVAAYGKAPDKSRVNSIGEIAGMGMAAIIVGEKYYLGNKTLMSKVGVDISNEEIPCGTVIYISKGKEYLGNIVISDEIKHGSPEAIRSLKTLGIKKTVMLTGDRASVAESVGASLAVDSVCAGLMPADKVAEVELLIKDGARLAFVGDGINDAPVLSLADVGIAMGSLGSDAAIESADVVIMDDDLSKIAVAIRIARKTLAIVRQNIVFALGVKGIILILGALGIANMWIAVFGDVGVMVIAILNAMRAMKKVKN